MTKPLPMRIYIDTSVLGGYFDAEFQDETRALFQLFHTGKIVAVISEMLIAEVARALKPVSTLLKDVIASGGPILMLSDEAGALQEAYIKAAVLTRRWEDDAMHVALATIARVDAIVSWNFKHLVDPRRVRAFNAVNPSNGYGMIEIRSPIDIVRTLEA